MTLLKHITALLVRSKAEPRYVLISGRKVNLYNVYARAHAAKLLILHTWFKHRNFLAFKDLKMRGASDKHPLDGQMVEALISAWKDLKNDLMLLHADNCLPDNHPASEHLNKARTLSKNLVALEKTFTTYFTAAKEPKATETDLLRFLSDIVDDKRSDELRDVAQFSVRPRFRFSSPVTEKRYNEEARLKLVTKLDESSTDASDEGEWTSGTRQVKPLNTARALVFKDNKDYYVRFLATTVYDDPF